MRASCDVEMQPTAAAGETLSDRLASTDLAVQSNKKVITYYEHFLDVVNIHMAKVFIFGFLGAMIYIVFPVVNAQGATNYWAYFLAKEMWWSWFGNSAFVELYEISLPGAPSAVYVYAYLFGYLLPPAIHILAYFINATADTTLNTMALTAALIVTTLCYGSWYLFVETPDTDNEYYNIAARGTSSGRTSTLGSGERQSALYDVFSAVWDTNDSEVGVRLTNRASANVDQSEMRVQWLKTMNRFKVIKARRESEVLRHSEALAISKGLVGAGVEVANPMFSNGSETGSGDEVAPAETVAESEFPEDWVDRQSTTVFGNEEIRDSGIFFWFPNFVEDYKLLPRFYMKLSDDHYSSITAPNRYYHFLMTFLFILGWVITYFIFMFFTFSFRESSKEDRTLWFVGFTIGNILCKSGMKTFGMEVDRGKVGTSSMFFIGEFLVTLFYYTFYRMLFEEFVSWPIFILVQIVHIFSEWMLYCVRATDWVYDFVKSLPWIFTPIKNAVIMKGLSHRDWQVFLALDFSMRTGVMVMSAAAFVLMLAATGTLPWIKSALRPLSLKHFGLVVAQILFASALEVINCYIMNKFFFEPNQLMIYKYCANCFSDRRFALITLLLTVCLLINPFAAMEIYYLNFTYK